MSISHDLEVHLPYLRRFARALTGSQLKGDDYVAAVLQTLITRPGLAAGASSPRLALYSLLLSRFRALHSAERDAVTTPPEQSLRRLTPVSRQAFLLSTLEGFRLEEVAESMDVTPAAASRLIAAASREISRQLSTQILIIEDEPVIALDLEALVEGAGHRVSGIASTHREALELAAAHPPGLVLADIQLADRSSGLDAVNELLVNLSVPVMFITAYPQQLLSGQRPEPAFVVTKPYSADTVLALIGQALFFDRAARPRDRIVA
ncbi:MAG: response regulator [Tistlia sp.]|uniref:response regulator n=1 Tax=Tistlia sp. TaxID=3057121 RepID=UPI0034A106F6